jgi:hypothetical protein
MHDKIMHFLHDHVKDWKICNDDLTNYYRISTIACRTLQDRLGSSRRWRAIDTEQPYPTVDSTTGIPYYCEMNGV